MWPQNRITRQSGVVEGTLAWRDTGAVPPSWNKSLAHFFIA